MSKILLLVLLTFIFTLPVSATSSSKGRTNARAKICQARENTIKNRTNRIITMVENQLENFTAKQDRVQKYYTEKVVPSGKTIPNYGDLVTDIQNKKTEVQTALAKARAEATSFSCNDADPQKSLKDFRTYMQQVNTALKNYRSAVKNLIVAVRSYGQS